MALRLFRRSLWASAAGISIAAFAPVGAHALEPDPANAAQAGAQQADGNGQATDDVDTDAANGDVVVTGSRVITNGNNSPTPVTVVATEQIQQVTPSNIPDGLNKLPVFSGSSNQSNPSVLRSAISPAIISTCAMWAPAER